MVPRQAPLTQSLRCGSASTDGSTSALSCLNGRRHPLTARVLVSRPLQVLGRIPMSANLSHEVGIYRMIALRNVGKWYGGKSLADRFSDSSQLLPAWWGILWVVPFGVASGYVQGSVCA